MVDLKDEERDELGKQPPRRLRKVRAAFRQPELAFEVPPQTQGDQEVMQHLKWREFVFIDDFAEAEHLFRAVSRPVKVFNRPVDKHPLERLRLGQADGPVFRSVLQRQHRRAQQSRMSEVGMVIGWGAERDHGAMLPQGFSRGQNAKGPRFSGGARQTLTRR